jgi:hypothetical protein
LRYTKRSCPPSPWCTNGNTSTKTTIAPPKKTATRGVSRPEVEVEVEVEVEELQKQKKKRSAPLRPIPKDFSISDSVRQWAKGKGYDALELHLEHFKLICQARNYKYSNWDAAFMRAISDNWAKVKRGSATADALELVLRGG